MLALEPELVHLDRLSDDPDAAHLGVYGPNPRFTASREFGEEQIAAGAELLAARAARPARRAAVRPARRPARVRRVRLARAPDACAAAPARRPSCSSRTRAASSRYVSAFGVDVDGTALDPAGLVLVNDAPGETGVPFRASELGPEHGFYLRRGQEARVALAGLGLAPGSHRVRAELGLGGVATLVLDEDVEFARLTDREERRWQSCDSG